MGPITVVMGKRDPVARRAALRRAASMGPITVVMGKSRLRVAPLRQRRLASMGPITVVMGKGGSGSLWTPIPRLQWGPSPS